MKLRVFMLTCFAILLLQNLYGQSITERILLEETPASFETIQTHTSQNIEANENGNFSLSADTGMIRLKIRYADALFWIQRFNAPTFPALQKFIC